MRAEADARMQYSNDALSFLAGAKESLALKMIALKNEISNGKGILSCSNPIPHPNPNPNDVNPCKT